MKFTPTFINGLKPKSKPYKIRENTGDPEQRGFAIRVSTAGAKAWTVDYTINGQRRLFTLGKLPAMPLGEAHEACRQARRLIAKGVCPKRHAQAQEAAQLEAQRREAAIGTVDQLLGAYIDHLAIKSERTATSVRRLFAKDVKPAIGNRKARDISPHDIASILSVIRKRGADGTAEHLRGYLRAAFQQAMVISTDAGDAPNVEYAITANPVAMVQAIPKGAPKTRALSMDEIAHLWEALNGATYQVAAVLKLILLTGARVEEILRMQWDELNKENSSLEIPQYRHKKHMNHVVPLTDTAIEIINTLPQLDDSPYLFPHRDRPDEFMRSDSLVRAVARICKRSGIDKFTARDLRRTTKTHLARLGIPPDIRNRIQGHAMADVASIHYDQYGYFSEKREALRKWEHELQKALGKSQSKIIYPDFSAR